MEHNPNDIDALLTQLRQAGEHPDPELLERITAIGPTAVHTLIDMAIDEKLYFAEGESPEVWAPLHAIRLLGVLRATEAIDPLLPLLSWDDDWLAQLLPECFGQIGEAAFTPLGTVLLDREQNVHTRARAADGLAKIAKHHPELRSAVVATLVQRLDPMESQVPDDEILNALVICALLDLRAVEAVEPMHRAFDEDRVDQTIVELDDVIRELGLATEPRATTEPRESGMQIPLRCTGCGYSRVHHLRKVFCDWGTVERRKRGEATPYNEFVIPQRITCPKCGAVDRYELTPVAYARFTAELVVLADYVERQKRSAGRKGAKPQLDLGQGPLVFRHFTIEDGREMHPYEARDMYHERIAAQPQRADIRVLYANLLRFLGRPEEAALQYRQALHLDPGQIDAALGLAELAKEIGDWQQARQLFQRVAEVIPRSRIAPEKRTELLRYAAEEIDALRARIGGSAASLAGDSAPADGPVVTGELPEQRQAVAASSRVGRNDPCPCGSGRKYKRCCGA